MDEADFISLPVIHSSIMFYLLRKITDFVTMSGCGDDSDELSTQHVES